MLAYPVFDMDKPVKRSIEIEDLIAPDDEEIPDADWHIRLMCYNSTGGDLHKYLYAYHDLNFEELWKFVVVAKISEQLNKDGDRSKDNDRPEP